MKKQEAISKVKEGSHAIHMNSKELKDIELLREILKEAFPNVDYNDSFFSGKSNFYFKATFYKGGIGMIETTLPTIKITEIEQKETFEIGELVEVGFNGIMWHERFYIGKTKGNIYVTEHESGIIEQWVLIRKINPAIEQIREIMKKNNISKEEI